MPNHLETQADVMGMNVKQGPTPEQWTTIETVAKEFHKDWKLDLKTKQIRRRDRTLLRVVRDFVWPKKHSVFGMYWWAKLLYAGKLDGNQSNYMPLVFPIVHDGMPFPGYPTKYRLVGWAIPKSDLKYLVHGPLADGENNDTIIVDDQTTWERLKEMWVKLAWPIKAVLGFMTAVVTITAFFQIVVGLL